MKRQLEDSSALTLSPFEAKVQEVTNIFREKMGYKDVIPGFCISVMRRKDITTLGKIVRKDSRLLGYFLLMAVAYNVPEVVAKCVENSKYINRDVLIKATILAFELRRTNCLKQIVGSVDTSFETAMTIEPKQIGEWPFECAVLLNQNKSSIMPFSKKMIDVFIDLRHYHLLFYCETELGVKVDIADEGVDVEYLNFKILCNTFLRLAHCTSLTNLYKSLYNPMSISGLVFDLDMNETMNCAMPSSNYLYLNADKFLDRKIARYKAGVDEMTLTVHSALNCSKDDSSTILNAIINYYSVATLNDDEYAAVGCNGTALDYSGAFKSANAESRNVMLHLTSLTNMYNGLYSKKNNALHNLLELISEKTDELDVMKLVEDDRYKGTQAYNQLNTIFRYILSAPDRDAIFAQYKKCTDIFIILCGIYGRHDVMYHLIKNKIYDLERYAEEESPIDFAAVEAAKLGHYISYRIALQYSSFHLEPSVSSHFDSIKDSSFETLYEYSADQTLDFSELEYVPGLNSWFTKSHYHMLYLVNERYISDAKQYDAKYDDGFDAAFSDKDLREYKLYKKVVDEKISALKLESISCLYRTIYPKEDIEILYKTLPAPVKAIADQDMDWFRFNPEMFFEKKVKVVFSQYFVTSELLEMLLCINHDMPFELSIMLAMHIVRVNDNILTYKERVMLAASSFTQADVEAVKIDGIKDLSDDAKGLIARIDTATKNWSSLFLN